MKWSHALAVIAASACFFTAAPAIAQPSAACPSAREIDAAPTRVRAGDAEALASFRAAPQCHHWVTFYFAAEKMFAAGERDEAVRWFYVGQLRGRTVASLDASGGTPSVVQALQHVVGQPVNEYAGSSRTGMIAAIDWATEWDREHPLRMDSVRGLGNSMSFGGEPLPFTRIQLTRASFNAAYEGNRGGMAQLREALSNLSDEDWRSMRAANGLN